MQTPTTIAAVVATILVLCAAACWLPAAEASVGHHGGCGAMCCSGKNNSCAARGPRTGRMSGAAAPKAAAAASQLFSSHCYCDESCIDTGDCCLDYADRCRPTDCIVSDWFAYDDCSKECGFGQKSRRRDVLVEAKNGGKRCPELRQTTTCIGLKCKTARHAAASRAARETANIMPAHYGKYRTMTEYDFSKDIRKNLFHQYYKKYDISRSGYCSRFKVTSTRKSCSNSTTSASAWASIMEHGAVVCVECQKTAMERSIGDRCKGHGLLGTDTNWNAVNVPGCHGWWQLIQEHGPCTCQDNGPLDLIFV